MKKAINDNVEKAKKAHGADIEGENQDAQRN